MSHVGLEPSCILLNLPAELLIHIFRQACTDGGFTAAALAATSRRVQEITSSFRYEAIALIGPKPIYAFTRLLLDCVGERPAVKDLFIRDEEPPRGHHPAAPPRSSTSDRLQRDLADWDYPKLFSRAYKAPPVPPEASKYGLEEMDMHQAISSILAHLASTVCRMTLVLSWNVSFVLSPTRMPNVTELTTWTVTTSGQDPISNEATYMRWLDEQRSRLPSLQRLHAIGINLSAAPHHMQAIPRQITLLRISNEVNAEYLSYMLGNPRLDRLSPVVVAAGAWLPPALQRILVLPKPSPSHYITRFRRTLDQWQASDHPLGKVVRIVENSGSIYEFQQCYDDWLDRAYGIGPGCWMVEFDP
jgi:hypothetical protein